MESMQASLNNNNSIQKKRLSEKVSMRVFFLYSLWKVRILSGVYNLLAL